MAVSVFRVSYSVAIPNTKDVMDYKADIAALLRDDALSFLNSVVTVKSINSEIS